MKRHLTLIFSLFFIVLTLGCEGTEPTRDLTAPMGLYCANYDADHADLSKDSTWKGTSETLANTFGTPCTMQSNTLKLKFHVYHGDGKGGVNFADGYNIYFVRDTYPTVNTASDISTNWSALKELVANHIDNNGDFISSYTTYSSNFGIAPFTSTQPTITLSKLGGIDEYSVIGTSTSEAKTFIDPFQDSDLSTTLSSIFSTLPNGTYFIFMTTIDSTYTIESKPSNFVVVTKS